MWLFPSEEILLKNLTDLLRNDIPRVQHDRAIMDALVKWSTLPKVKVASALTYGQGPRVKVKQIDTVPLEFPMRVPKAFGFTPNNSTTMIELERVLVRFLEAPLPPKHTPVPKEPLASAIRQLRKFIRNTLLHELVHWGNNVQGHSWADDIEAGEQFDADADLIKDPLPELFLKAQRIEDTPIYIPPRDLPPNHPLR